MVETRPGLEPLSTSPERAGTRTNGRRDYQTSGHYTLKAAVKALGGRRLVDLRTSVGKALAAWRADLVADLGGAETLSTQQAAIVDLAVRTKLLLDSLDAWLLKQKTLVNARKRSVYPVLLQRTQLADALARYLTQLGLERRRAQVPELGDYLRKKAGANA
jgi:hypothetical protein